ncbi:EamA family transporter [bacterium]|nr:EamA family transporter [bacterium]
MSPTAIVLLVIAAFLHAGWNLLTKSKHPSAAFFLVANLAAVVLLLPVLVVGRHALAAGIPPRVWALLVVTGFFLALYYASLAGAYRAGEMSVAYPLARSSPIIVVAVVTVILGRRTQVSPECIVGIVLVVAGCFLIPMRRFADWRLRNYLNATCALALLAAVGTAGYSIVDDEALRQLRNNPALGLGTVPTTILYAGLEALSASGWLAVFVLARPAGRSRLAEVWRAHKRHAALAGAAIYLTYAMVLVSMAFVQNVSYVVAFRQLSIPLGAAFGILFLKEGAPRPKLVGVAIVLVGLLLVAIR